MSAGNKQMTRLMALGLNKKTVTSAYTIRTGRDIDCSAIDNPVELEPAAAIAVTLPDGYAMGQTVLISYQGASTTVVTLTVTHHVNGDAGTVAIDLADEYILLLWTGTEWATVKYTTGADVA